MQKKGTISKDHKPPGALRDSAAGKRSCTAGELGEGQERPKRSRVLDSGDSDWSFEQGDDDGEANDTPCVACGSRKQVKRQCLSLPLSLLGLTPVS